MDTVEKDNWYEANQRYLVTALDQVRNRMEHYAESSESTWQGVEADNDVSRALGELAAGMSLPPTLETLCRIFNLSSFERNVLLLCAGVELDSSFTSLCAKVQQCPGRAYPTFSLALAVFPAAHWSGLSPAAPLRYWRLLEITGGDTLTAGRLRIDERILNYLSGVFHMDERLMGFIKPLYAPGDLVPSYRALADRIQQVWSRDIPLAELPVIRLCGRETAAKQSIAADACSSLGLNLYKISADTLPAAPGERDALLRLWQRETLLEPNALLIDCDETGSAAKGSESTITPFIEDLPGFLAISSRFPHPGRLRPQVTLQVGKPGSQEQHTLWQKVLGPAARGLTCPESLDSLVSQFNLSSSVIASAGTEAMTHPAARVPDKQNPGNGFGHVLWEICRVQSRPKLDELAQRIEPAADWQDLVLPRLQVQVLKEISLHVRQRAKVYETWGFGAKSARGLGISALFTGESGTGKTMAAEVLAGELQLDLYRIDLSQVVSKYIGETEKNLRRIFDAAEDGGVILFFDEADALFGKRTQVKDSHDRYANIEVSYLLQRMEAYRGLAILTTNMKDALDTAFLRRLRFVVKFPFPNPEQRAEIWQHIFPAKTPKETLEPRQLAQLNIPGGSIRNIALNAAFLAAEAREPVGLHHLLQAARREYAKLEKTLNAVEIKGWEL